MSQNPDAEPRPLLSSCLREAAELIADALLDAYLKDRRRARMALLSEPLRHSPAPPPSRREESKEP
ncbi:MAG: hypothetical protein JW751_23185 [Polyangiaceae bacterium]|nr:hypothetical protein [Polyangiaceae bacterium]